MYRFETISILVTGYFIFIVAVKAELLNIVFPETALNYSLWLMTVLFFVNTFGNVISKNKIEQKIFTPLSLVMAICSIILTLIK